MKRAIFNSVLFIVCTIGFATILIIITSVISEYLHIRDFKRRLKTPWKPPV